MTMKWPVAILAMIAPLCRIAPAWGATPVMVQSAAETLGSRVSVVSPAYCSDVKGDTTVTLAAPGFKIVSVKSWKQGDGFGSDSTVTTVALDGHDLLLRRHRGRPSRDAPALPAKAVLLSN